MAGSVWRWRLFRLGLPNGLTDRLARGYQGERLTVYFISRIDQIYLKFYAAVDQFGSYHASDLNILNPTDDELLQAIQWARTHDNSQGFNMAIRLFLQEFGYEYLADRI